MPMQNLHNSNKDTKPPGNRKQGLSRRSFLAAGLAAPFIVPRHVLGGTGYQTPSDTLTIACVGAGGMGRHYLEGCKDERIVALCDLDHNLVQSRGVFEKYPTARRYHDFREMFDKEAKNFDALIIATPDHTHAIILMTGLQLGKHIYCAKPITHSIGEARKVKQAVLKNKNLVTQSSVQAAGTEAALTTTEYLMSAVIGPVLELHIWCDHPAYPCSLLRPMEVQTPPPGMDWDLWIGPAPYRPYHCAYHPENWRPWWDFGSGTVGDMACHTLHIFFKELQLGAPTVVYGYGSTRHDGFFKPAKTPECQSHSNMVTWEFPARRNLPPLKVYWYDGGMKPHRPEGLNPRRPVSGDGLLFVGEKGQMMTDYYGSTRPLLLPEEQFRDFQAPPKTLPRTEHHYREWTIACKTGSRTACPIEFGCEMTEMALLGTLALKTGQLLRWDAQAMRVTNDEKANSLIDPPYRAGWSLKI